MDTNNAYIGTSGWNYKHWKGVFYPKDLKEPQWLEHYVKYFNSVELNVTFYRLVDRKTFINWRLRTPKDFVFVAKGSRYITHMKRLKDAGQPLKLFFDNAAGLKEKLSAVLWQLPGGFKKDIERLKDFCDLLKKSGLRHVFEFRDESWFEEETFDLLKKYNYCLCIAHSGRYPTKLKITSDYIYLRFHGGGGLYSSDYSDSDLKDWADFARKTKLKLYAFFNNDVMGYAVKNALKFREFYEKISISR